MIKEDFKDISNFFIELQSETDRGLPLVASALIDKKLLATLQSFFCIGKAANHLLIDNNAPLGSFSSRIEACFALGLIDEFEYKEISLIRKIRNEFAHSLHGFSFKNEKVIGWCSNLQSDLPLGSDYPINDPKYRFINSTICLVLRLYYRNEYVAKEKRNQKTWIDPNEMRWHSVLEEPLPDRKDLVVLTKSKNPK
ncbi:MAG: putative mannitol operon repressor [uncultured bacterium]|nr:MAG: putative mannitol operon repressor [uncultured bacterium]HCS40515.1 transcriptional regulator [Anaerolineaceae bacterium]